MLPEHDKKPVHYMIVPNMESAKISKEDERPFFLRIFASDPIELIQMQQTIELPL